MLKLLSTICVFWLDMIPSIIDMYIITFDSNEYQETAIFLLKKFILAHIRIYVFMISMQMAREFYFNLPTSIMYT